MKGQRHRDRPLIIIYDFIYLFCCKNHYTKDRQITNPAFPSCPKDKNTLVIMSLPSGLNHFSFLLLNLFGWYKSSTFGLVFRNWLWMRKPFFDLVSLAAGSNNWIWWFILYTIPNYVVWLLFHCVTGRRIPWYLLVAQILRNFSRSEIAINLLFKFIDRCVHSDCVCVVDGSREWANAPWGSRARKGKGKRSGRTLASTYYFYKFNFRDWLRGGVQRAFLREAKRRLPHWFTTN